MIHTVCFSIVNEAEVHVFLEFSCFFYDLMDVGNLISDSSAFSKSSLNIWKFAVHVLVKPSLENFEHYFGFYSRATGFYSRANGDLHEGLRCLALPRTAALSTPVAVAGHC